MDERQLELRIRERAGMRTSTEARRALGTTLGALRCALEDDDARALAMALPGRSSTMHRPASSHVSTVEELYAEANRRERVGPGFAMEHVQVVLEVLSEELDPELVARLRRHLPGDIAGLLRARAPSPEAPPHVHLHAAREAAPRPTLSRARPGTREPIAEAAHPLAHAGSIARQTAAHAERMIATAPSTRPGTEDETLSAARDRRGPK